MIYSTDLNTTEDFIITSKGYDNLGEWYIINKNKVCNIINSLLFDYKILEKKDQEVFDRYIKWLNNDFSSIEMLYLDIAIAEYILSSRYIISIYNENTLVSISKTLCEMTKLYADQGADVSNTTCIFNNRVSEVDLSDTNNSLLFNQVVHAPTSITELIDFKIAGLMKKSDYDSDDNSIVDEVDNIDGGLF